MPSNARGYTSDGDFIELGAACTNCGRIVEPQDINIDGDSDAVGFQIICFKCHGIVFRTVVAVPGRLDEDDIEVAP